MPNTAHDPSVATSSHSPGGRTDVAESIRIPTTAAAGAGRRLFVPVAGTGLFMALYLLLRPYGDTGTPAETAAAFASSGWLIAHLLGALALACFALVTVQLADQLDTVLSRLARALAVAGTALTLLYYGAETFALHILGRVAQAGGLETLNPAAPDQGAVDPAVNPTALDPAVLELADQIRFQPAAVAVFAIGLLAISTAAIVMAVASRRLFRPGWTVWPLAIAMAVFPAQFYLPLAGRMGFGIVAAVAAVVALVGLTSSTSHGAIRSASGRSRAATRSADAAPS